jgi:hypothetical protein
MRFIKTFVLLILSSVLFLVSIFLVLAGILAADHELTSWIIHMITKIEMPIVFIVCGFLFFLAGLLLYNRIGRSPDQSGTFTFESEKGAIDISLHALEDYISKHFAQKPVVHNIRTRVGTSRDRKRLRVRATISVWSEQSLRNAGETVQQEIAHCLKEGLGLDNVENVIVSVDKIIASKSSKHVATP